MAEHGRVVGAKLANGLLSIELMREAPKTMKARRIAIESGSDAKESVRQLLDQVAS